MPSPFPSGNAFHSARVEYSIFFDTILVFFTKFLFLECLLTHFPFQQSIQAAYPSIPPSIPLPVQIKSVVTQELLIRWICPSTAKVTAHMTRKYTAPAANPHRNLRLAAPFEKNSPASSDDTQYTTIIAISTTFSPSENLYNNPATATSSIPVIR